MGIKLYQVLTPQKLPFYLQAYVYDSLSNFLILSQLFSPLMWNEKTPQQFKEILAQQSIPPGILSQSSFRSMTDRSKDAKTLNTNANHTVRSLKVLFNRPCLIAS